MSCVIWQTRSAVLHDSFRIGRLAKNANGGNAYEFHAMQALSRSYGLKVDRSTVREGEENQVGYLYRIWRNPPVADVIVKEPGIVALGKSGTAPVEIGMVHHLNYHLQDKSLRHRLFFARLFQQLPRLSAVVTVSQYWQRELQDLGCERVEVIYNSFDLSEFVFNDAEIDQLLVRLNISRERPLVYIGNAGKQKGGAEVYHALKDEDYTLVMTGANQDPNLPVLQLNLTRRDYLRLLRACDVVISMSRVLEGWNRVAHEAMLCQTPVIGSGMGGMRELLEGGGQVMLREPGELPKCTRHVLARKEELGQRGYTYVRQFNTDYFADAWTSLVRDLVSCSVGACFSAGGL